MNKLGCGAGQPLHVLRCVSRAGATIDKPEALRWQRALWAWDGALQPELLVKPGDAALRARLQTAPLHVLHFDGTLALHEGAVRFATGPGESISDADLFEAARTAGVELLVLDLHGSERVEAPALASVATAALAAGIGDVVLLDPRCQRSTRSLVYANCIRSWRAA